MDVYPSPTSVTGIGSRSTRSLTMIKRFLKHRCQHCQQDNPSRQKERAEVYHKSPSVCCWTGRLHYNSLNETPHILPLCFNQQVPIALTSCVLAWFLNSQVKVHLDVFRTKQKWLHLETNIFVFFPLQWIGLAIGSGKKVSFSGVSYIPVDVFNCAEDEWMSMGLECNSFKYKHKIKWMLEQEQVQDLFFWCEQLISRCSGCCKFILNFH